MICVIEKCNQSAINTKAYKGFLILFEKTFSLFNDLQKVSFFWPGKQEFIKCVLQINKWSAYQSLSCRCKDYLQIQVQSANPRFMYRSKFNLQMEELSTGTRTICRSKTDLQLIFNCNWLVCNCILQLMDTPVELYYCYYTQTDMTDE